MCFINKEIYCIFKTRCIISVLYSTKYCLFRNLTILCSNNRFFVNNMVKFKLPTWSFKRYRRLWRKNTNKMQQYTGLFISPSGISKIDCATIKTDTAERRIENLSKFLSNLTAARYVHPWWRGGSWQTLLAHARQSQPMGPDGHFVSQRTGSHAAGISCSIHELFCL